MFRHLILCLLLVTVASTAGAQKPTGLALEGRAFIFTDDYGIGTDNWPYLFADGYAPLPYRRDTLHFASEGKGGAFPRFSNGWGLRADGVKVLASLSKHSGVDWGFGAGYRRYITRDEKNPFDEFRDTTLAYPLNSLKRAYTQHYADLQTRVVYKVMEESGRFGFYLGFALQVSLSFAGRIREDFTRSEARWSTAGRSWVESGKTALHQEAPAKKISYFSWGVPAGLFIRLSDHLFLLPEISYWHNINRKYIYPATFIGKRKSFSESGYLTMGVRYSW